MSNLTLNVDYWTLVWPRFIQGFGQGFIFVPLSTLALATIRKDRLGNATAAFNVIRNVGGACGVALAATLLSRRSQYHQTTLVGHVNVWSVDHHVLRDHLAGSAHAPDSVRAARGGSSAPGAGREARRAQTDKSFSMTIVSTHLPSS